ncbi:HpcH/HpaI aldolase/citrate lyase family protein [Acinetobacter pittii]|uniref:HpcH/HpaI aldolase/citrate lyase family protein n=1 Tax=Acinetobacter pittii TaxID=48296 RepID=UPI00388ED687
MQRTPRSFLFVPANRVERFSKALDAGSDAVIIDLEDAVPVDLKEEARQTLINWLEAHPEKDIMVRVNSRQTPWFLDDISLAKYPNVSAIVLPKTESIADIEVITDIKAISIYPLIETPIGFSQVRTIARANHVQALMFGSIDFQLEMGMNGGFNELLYFRNEIVLASKLAGIDAPIDGVTVDIKNDELLTLEASQANNLGFSGKLCIHPLQVNIVNQVFSPSREEIEWAQKVLKATDEAKGQAISLDGKMIDLPVIRKAEQILKKSAY